MSTALFLVSIAWIGQCQELRSSNKIPVHFEEYQFPLNSADVWNVNSTTSGSRSITTACTKQFSDLCIEFDGQKSGFSVLFDDDTFDFANDSDWTHIDAVYPVEAMKHLRRRLVMRDDDRYNNYDNTYGYGYGYGYGHGMYGGMRGRYGYGGMHGMGMNGGGMYGGSMYGGGMHGGGMYGGGMYGGYQRHRQKRKKTKIDKYLDDGGQFGKMGFPSLSGNMMGVVQSSKGMAPFQMVPPSIHINADFRRLLGISSELSQDNMDYEEMTGVLLQKCVIVKHAEICGVYNMTDFSIGVSLTMYNPLENTVSGNKQDMNLNMMHRMERDSENGEGNDQDTTTEIFPMKMVKFVWSEEDMEMKCNEQLLSVIGFTICIEDGLIAFDKTSNVIDDDRDTANHLDLSNLSFASTSLLDWEEVYMLNQSDMDRLCRFIADMSLCIKRLDSKHIAAVSVEIEIVP